MMDKPLLNPHGEAWVILRSALRARIEKLRDDLEQPGADDLIRGEIRGLRWLISQVDKELPEDDNEADYSGPSTPS